MLENLNEQQRKAVQIIDGPVIVFAGAGSGKTRTLTYRLAYMIREKNIPPYTILAITFTNKATNEMRERIYKLVGDDANTVTISTFHSLFARILRNDIHHLGYKNSFSIIDVDDQVKEINVVLDKLGLDKKEYNARSLQKEFSKCKSFNQKPLLEKHVYVYNAYEDHLKDHNLLDFDDLLLKTYELFLQNPTVLSKYQQRYLYILVDEFQDTSEIQYKIIKMLAMKHQNIFVVGDDDQSIYGFRGTDIRNIENFKNDFPNHQFIYLTQNYRSKQSILDGSNSLISHNIQREKKELWSDDKGSLDNIIIKRFPTYIDEVNYVIRTIGDLYDGNFNDFAILYRSNVLSRNFELSLIRSNYPHRIYGGVSYMRRKEVKDIIAYLRLIVDHNDFFSFKRVVNVPARGIGPKTIDDIYRLFLKYDFDLFKAIDNSEEVLSKKRFQTLVDFKNMIISLRNELDNLSLIEFYDLLLQETGYLCMLNEDGDTEERIEHLEEFKSILFKYDLEAGSQIERLQRIFDETLLSEDESIKGRDESDKITLSTIHSAKGLEFKYVFVIGLEEGVFPSNSSLNNAGDLEEERRVCYVACTRAKEKLFLLSSQQRLLYGNYNYNSESRFVEEFKNGLVDYEEPEEDKVAIKKTHKLSNETDYQIQDKIVHKMYGEGIVVAINGIIGHILFLDEGKIRKFDLTHSAIRKKEE